MCAHVGVVQIIQEKQPFQRVVVSRDEALQLMAEYGADGAMIATAAETNPSVFRAESDGGKAPWQEVVKEYVTKNFDQHPLLDYALAVERVTTQKKDTLILNVDGCIAVCFVDLLRSSGAFSREEADDYINLGGLNGIFILARSIGFIGHSLDQRRLRAPLYRHPADDIFIDMGPSRVTVDGRKVAK